MDLVLLGVLSSTDLKTYKGFTTEWTVAGDATARTVTLPLTNNGSFNCVVDWGDGTAISAITAYNDADRIHTYAADGTYEIEIRGECPAWSFNNGGDKLKCTDIIYWGDSAVFGGFSSLYAGFYGCTNLKTTGTGKIIAKNNLTTLGYLFNSCIKITNITENIFDNCLNVTNFTYTFYNCQLLASIPSDLFRYNTAVTSFNGIFYGDTALITIPTDIFRYNTAVTNMSYVFYTCTALTTIPTDIFRYNTLVTTFEYCFANCSGLETTPDDLFRYNLLVTKFVRCFSGTQKLQINPYTFYANGEQSTRFLNKSVDFSTCFNRTEFTGTQGTAPDLWNCDFGTGTATKTDCFNGVGNSLTSISNYGDIPAEWI